MLGFGKKKINPFTEILQSSLARTMFDDDPIRQRPQKEVYQYFYKNGEYNASMPLEWLAKLPYSWQRYWRKIDFDLLFGDEILEESKPELTPIRKRTDIMPDLNKLSIEKKTQLKAIALGELKREDYEKQDPLWDVEE